MHGNVLHGTGWEVKVTHGPGGLQLDQVMRHDTVMVTMSFLTNWTT